MGLQVSPVPLASLVPLVSRGQLASPVLLDSPALPVLLVVLATPEQQVPLEAPATQVCDLLKRACLGSLFCFGSCPLKVNTNLL